MKMTKKEKTILKVEDIARISQKGTNFEILTKSDETIIFEGSDFTRKDGTVNPDYVKINFGDFVIEGFRQYWKREDLKEDHELMIKQTWEFPMKAKIALTEEEKIDLQIARLLAKKATLI